eukprot:gnl/TRDRNA2_/TRDRNA2_171219_c7_seq1.p2 gnl/TRDRNA2_/TRDRNA2_171219_c7~~gnl/TRDRNA2_/TRDRNA2_171219_c7_seq1.p2  ORF type:complete len:167 (+),score=32.48 gnl/TRDRNA2_/TRDRNA2_171219_c7_seq1:454-954(+)
MSSLAKTNKLRLPPEVRLAAECKLFRRKAVASSPDVEAGSGYGQAEAPMPSLSTEDASKILTEFRDRYAQTEFQARLIDAYCKRLNDKLTDGELIMARNDLCWPVQKEILPKYGFEATTKGVLRITRTLTSPEMMEDPAVKALNMKITELLTSVPGQVAVEKTRKK